MKKYRVTIWTSVDIEAESESLASDLAMDKFVNGQIKNRDFFCDPEEKQQ